MNKILTEQQIGVLNENCLKFYTTNNNFLSYYNHRILAESFHHFAIMNGLSVTLKKDWCTKHRINITIGDGISFEEFEYNIRKEKLKILEI